MQRTIATFAPQFSGYQQHDSQELIAFLLDGLHEDLNRVRKKPYVDLSTVDGLPEAQAADESWRLHKLRSDSIVVDLFQGQFRSHVLCPRCGRASVTFDPFMYLSLPIPSFASETLTCTVIPAEPDVPAFNVRAWAHSRFRPACRPSCADRGCGADAATLFPPVRRKPVACGAARGACRRHWRAAAAGT